MSSPGDNLDDFDDWDHDGPEQPNTDTCMCGHEREEHWQKEATCGVWGCYCTHFELEDDELDGPR